MIKNKKIFILGMAKSGYEAAKLLATDNKVLVTDLKEQDEKITKELKDIGVEIIITDDPTNLLDETYDLMVKNPGIKYTHKTVLKAKELNIPVINEVELAFNYLNKNANIIGVTGSNGKTTTVTLIYKMLKSKYSNTYLGGNIGTPLCNFVKKIKDNDYLVLEISDHQLVDMYNFKTNISVLNNIYEAHTDFHDSHEKYKQMKKKIFANHTHNDIAIINKDNEEAVELTNDLIDTKYYFSKKAKEKAYIANDAIYYENEKIIDLKDIKLKGSHNYENIMAAIIAVKQYNVDNKYIIDILKTFGGVEHRIEYVDKIDGVSYYNDSKATNVESTKIALNSFKEPTLLILGGLDRNHSFDELKESLKNTKYIACYGETKNRIYEFAKSLNIECDIFDNLTEATNSCHIKAKENDVVLLSPACASWDQYNTFEQRGNEFKSIVEGFKKMDIEKYKNVYFIGIGGISMSGIALILKNKGFNVSGSNNVENDMTIRLENQNIKVNLNQIKENITDDIDLVVYTAAIPDTNEELVKARELNIKTISRGEFLGELTKIYNNTIGVAGTHGKTSTSSMLSIIFMEAKKDPTIQIGATLTNLDNNNYKIGNSDNFIIESCEYKDSYLSFHEKSAIITNIDNDHLDYFGNIENIENSFRKYVSHLKDYLVINFDDERCKNLSKYTNAKIITVGKTKDADYHYENIKYNDLGFASYDVYNKEKFIGEVQLSVTGEHNVFNSLATIAMSLAYNIDFEDIKNALIKYKGASRRLEYKGMFKNARVFDDYGHHPTEINATVNGIKNIKHNKTWVIFEAHTYSRYEAHMKEFAKSLSNFDNIILIDIYAAREKNINNVSLDSIIEELKTKYNKEAIYIKDYNEIKSYLNEKIEDNDIILTLGAGNVTKIATLLTNN